MSSGPQNIFGGPLVIAGIAVEDVVDDDPNNGGLPLIYERGSEVVDQQSGARYINRGTRLLPDWSFVGDSANQETEIFELAPGLSALAPTRFQTWADLYTAYDASRQRAPRRDRQIIFNDAGLAAGTPIAITRTGGVSLITSETRFSAPVTSGSDRVVIEVDDDVEWEIQNDSQGAARLQMQGLSITRRAGASATPTFAPQSVNPPSEFTIRLDDVVISSLATNGPVSKVPPGSGTNMRLDLQDAAISSDEPLAGWFLDQQDGSLSISAKGRSRINANTLVSSVVLGGISSSVSVDTEIGPQDGLQIPDGEELNGPGASANVRPSPTVTVLSAVQLATDPADNDRPLIKQAFLAALLGQPDELDSYTFTDGVIVESYVFKAVPVNPNDVQIGASLPETLANLATVVTAESAVWDGAFIRNSQTDRAACLIVRKTQAREHYPDRGFAPVNASNNLLIGAIRAGANGYIPLSYSSIQLAVAAAADPQISQAGFAAVRPLPDGFLVQSLDGRTSGFYSAQQAVGPGGAGFWQLVTVPAGPVLQVNAAGNFVVERDTRLVVITLAGAAAATIFIPDTYPSSETLNVVRTDGDNTSTATLTPVGGTIDGNPNLPVPDTTTKGGPSGLILAHAGANAWWSVSQT